MILTSFLSLPETKVVVFSDGELIDTVKDLREELEVNQKRVGLHNADWEYSNLSEADLFFNLKNFNEELTEEKEKIV